jgi:hypothetical protein
MRASAFLIVTLVSAPAAAQQRPDFSGTWTATTEAPASLGAAPSPIFGQQFALRQEGQTLRFSRRMRDTTLTASYPLDGSEVRNRVPGSLCMADSEAIETAAWERNDIVMTMVGSIPPGGGAPSKAGVRRVLRLESPDTLIVEGNMREGPQAQPRAVGTVYKRSPEPWPAGASGAAPKTPATIAQMSWLSGVWIGASGSEERWTPSASGAMMAVSRTIRNGIVSEFEFLCIVERGGGLVYQAMPNGRSPATDFTLTKIDATSATFENPSHDFPKSIRYTLQPDGTLEAVVGGDPSQRAITFKFRKQP